MRVFRCCWNKGLTLNAEQCEFNKPTLHFYGHLTESSHGKGAADGVGAAVKRLADNLVLSGVDVSDTPKLVTNLQERSKVEIYYVDPVPVVQLPEELPCVRGVMKAHQVYSRTPTSIKMQPVSCYCTPGLFCQCHNPTDQHVQARPSIV